MLEAFILSAYLEIGWIPHVDFTTWEPNSRREVLIITDSFYADIDAKLSFYFLWIRAGFKVYAWDAVDFFSMSPHTLDSRVSFGLAFGPVTVGHRHVCRHPVMPRLRGSEPIRYANDSAEAEWFLRVDIGGER